MEADDKGEDIMKKVLICEGGTFLEYNESTVNWYLDSGSNVVAIAERTKGFFNAYKVAGYGEVNENVEVELFASALVELGGQHE